MGYIALLRMVQKIKNKIIITFKISASTALSLGDNSVSLVCKLPISIRYLSEKQMYYSLRICGRNQQINLLKQFTTYFVFKTANISSSGHIDKA